MLCLVVFTDFISLQSRIIALKMHRGTTTCLQTQSQLPIKIWNSLFTFRALFRSSNLPHAFIGALVSKHLTDSIFGRYSFKPYFSPFVSPHSPQMWLFFFFLFFFLPWNYTPMQILGLVRSSNFSISTYNCCLVLAKLNSQTLEN